jgi:hypothetical protein
VKSIHVEPEVLAAWSEGTLPSSDARQVEAHLADCPTCQETLAVFARTEPPPVVASDFRSVVSGLSWRWAVPLAAAATVAAIWVAIPEKERTAQLNPTAEAPLSEAAPPPAADLSSNAAAPAPAKQRAARDDAIAGSLADQTAPELRKKIASEEKTDQFASSREAKERDQDLKAEAAPTARSVAPAQVAAAPGAPPPAQEQDRSRAEGQASASLLRQAAPAEVASPDPQVRWRIVPTGRLERSTNAGRTWEAVTLPQTVRVTAVRAPSLATAIVTTADGRQFRTDDQGKSWNLVQP